jgi:phosphoribosylformylglycinamidine synthase
MGQIRDKLDLFQAAKVDAEGHNSSPTIANGSISVPKIIVEVMPKADLLDPAGKAVANALQRKGNAEITNVRIGKRIELHYESTPTDKDIEAAKQIAADFLSNGVIEDVAAVTVEN